MNDDEADTFVSKAIDHALASMRMQMAQVYIQAGRVHQHLTGDELQKAYVEAFKQWVGAAIPAPSQLHNDLLAELELRGLPEPTEEIEQEREKLANIVKQLVEANESNLELGRLVIDRYEEALDKKQ